MEAIFRFAVGEEAVVSDVRDIHGRHALELAREVAPEHAEAGATSIMPQVCGAGPEPNMAGQTESTFR